MPFFIAPLLYWSGGAAAAYIAGRRMLTDERELDRYGCYMGVSYTELMNHLGEEREVLEYKEWVTELRIMRPEGWQMHMNTEFIARGGIPHDMRSDIWMQLSGATDNRLESKNYSEFEEATGETREAILKDINRTLPKSCMFCTAGGDGQQQLFNVLSRFCNKYKHGYTQGMNMLVGFMLLADCSEEQSFWLLNSIVTNKKYSHNYYTDCRQTAGLQQCKDDLCMFERLLNHHVPKLLQLFQGSTMSPSFILCLQWVLCIFVDCIATEYCLIIFDLYMLEGLPVLYNIALNLLKRYEDDVMTLDVQTAVQSIRSRLREETDLTDLLIRSVADPCRITLQSLDELRRISLLFDELSEQVDNCFIDLCETQSCQFEHLLLDCKVKLPNTPSLKSIPSSSLLSTPPFDAISTHDLTDLCDAGFDRSVLAIPSDVA